MGRTVIYANRIIRTYLDLQAMNKTNVLLRLEEFNGKPITTFRGIPSAPWTPFSRTKPRWCDVDSSLKETPVTYTTVNSQICPGLAADDKEWIPNILYFDGAWNVSNPVATRDDTQDYAQWLGTCDDHFSIQGSLT